MVCITSAPSSIIWPMRSRKQQVHVLGIDERQRDAQHRRQRQQHVAGEPAVRRVDAHLAEDLEPLADDVREVLENLREVAAGLALDQHRGGEEPDVERAACGTSGCRARPSSAGRSSARRTSCGTRARPAPASRRRPSSGRSRTRGRPSARARSGRAPRETAPRTRACRRVRLIFRNEERQREADRRADRQRPAASARASRPTSAQTAASASAISSTPLMLAFIPD